ncbi:two-component sensor histidine kinase [Paenibacillus sp. 598K]|nr:two-component sensor histidine kinase [Paenibacillus sp. 598K]
MLPYFMPDMFTFLNKPYVSPERWGTQEIEAQKTMARLMSAYPSINSSIKGLVLYGMNGSVNGYRLSGDNGINMRVNAEEEVWYQDVVARKGGFVVTGVQQVHQFNGPPLEAIIGARLLMDEDYHPLGVIAMFISPQFIPSIIRSLDYDDVQIAVLDSKRHLIYASSAELSEQALPAGVDDKGVWEMELKLEDKSRTFSGVFLKSNYLDWHIYMGIDQDELLQGSNAIRSFTLVIVVAVALLAILLSYMLSKGLSKPIARLIRSMRSVEKGEFDAPIPYGREDEIGQLERSYSKMVLRLETMIQSIEENERQKRHAELYALRARIQPHFLYNTLNSIRMLAMLQQSHKIAHLIQSLNKLLYANMKLDTELVTLSEEFELLQSYARLMDLRFDGVFQTEWHIAERVRMAVLPPMLLQPLLENAIFHGSKGLGRILTITIMAELSPHDEGLLVISICDDGMGFASDEHKIMAAHGGQQGQQGHIGLQNVQDRIRLRFGEAYGVSVVRENGLTLATVTLPFRQSKDGED